jgi:hypothetical protein
MKPWPNGVPMEGGHDCEVVGTCLMLSQFMRAFGKSTCLQGSAKWGDKWSNIMVEELLTDLQAEEPCEYLTGFITSLLQLVAQRDVRVIHPVCVCVCVCVELGFAWTCAFKRGLRKLCQAYMAGSLECIGVVGHGTRLCSNLSSAACFGIQVHTHTHTSTAAAYTSTRHRMEPRQANAPESALSSAYGC